MNKRSPNDVDSISFSEFQCLPVWKASHSGLLPVPAGHASRAVLFVAPTYVACCLSSAAPHLPPALSAGATLSPHFPPWAPANPPPHTHILSHAHPPQQVEQPYQRLLQAASADAAAVEWTAVCLGLRSLDAFLARHGSTEGPYFMGREPSLAEAATAPSLFRMVATVSGPALACVPLECF